MKGIYFASLYFRVSDLIREIRENNNPAKISTYTVFALALAVSACKSAPCGYCDSLVLSQGLS